MKKNKKSFFITNDDEQYKYISTCRGTINYEHLVENLENFSAGFIHLSKFTPLRKTMNK